MLRNVRTLALFVLCLSVLAALPGGPPAVADPGAVEAKLQTRMLGNADAPVTVEEYSSLTCPHCATFKRQVLPQLKADYIDTGKVKMTYHDFPLDALALAAAMITRCVPEDQYWSFLDRLFVEQDSWMTAEKPAAMLSDMAAEAGLSNDGFNACFANAPLMAGLRDKAREAAAAREIRSTPTFFINGERISGARPYEDFQEVIERKLAETEAEARAATRPASAGE